MVDQQGVITTRPPQSDSSPIVPSGLPFLHLSTPCRGVNRLFRARFVPVRVDD